MTFAFVKAGFYFAANHFLTVNFLSEIFIHTFLLFGISYSFHMYFLVGMPLIYSLFTKQQQSARVIYSLLSVSLLIVAVFFSDGWVQSYPLAESKVRLMQLLNTVSSFIVLSVAIYLFTNLMEKAEQNAYENSVTDFLTGLSNRRFFINQAEEVLELSKRNNEPFSVVFVDIDHFKQINDHYGHAVGDQVLKMVAGLLKENVRSSDLLSRFGGEEFVILFANTPREQAMAKAEVIRLGIRAAQMPVDGNVTASFEVTSFYQDDYELRAILKRADDAMYLAKDAGRNCIKSDIQPNLFEKVTNIRPA